MSKTETGQIVILMDQLAYGCQSVYRGTICRVSDIHDNHHVELEICPSGVETRNSNINKFRLPFDAEELEECLSRFEEATSYSYARID